MAILFPSPSALSQALHTLRSGEVIGLPTETVYGLAGDGLNPRALARIFELKRRPLYDPLILHASDPDAALYLAQEIPAAARRLAAAFWPGPLTLVLRKNASVPDLATSGLPAVALRVPAHPVARELLQLFGGPLAAPSANRFGRISPTTAQAVAAELEDLPLILDGGPCAIGLESTVLDFSRPDQGISLLRAGGIPVEELEALVGPLQRSRILDHPERESPAGPGQLRHHYAPGKPLRLVASVTEIPAEPESGWLAFGPLELEAFPGRIEQLSAAGDLREAAARFFSALRALDDHPQVRTLYALPLPAHGLGLAVNERLERARH